jgi:hypothetical protein
MAVTGQVRLTKRDIKRAIYEGSPMMRFRWVVFAAMVGVVSERVVKSRSLAEFLVPIVFWGIVHVMVEIWLARRITRAMPDPDGEVVYSVEDEVLVVRGPASTATVAYGHLSGLIEGKTSFVLAAKDQDDVHMIKRAFSPDALERVRTILRARVKTAWGRILNDYLHLVIVIVAIVLLAYQFLPRR